MLSKNQSNLFHLPNILKYIGEDEIHLLGWNVPPDEYSLIHSHWHHYKAPPYFAHILLAILYSIIWFISIFGNGIAIWIFSTSKSLQTSSNMFIINLAVYDLIMMLEIPMFFINSLEQRFIGFEIGCNVYAMLGSISGIGASITNAVIAFDRYKTISCPLNGRLNHNQAYLLIIFTWIYTMPFTILPMVNVWGRYIPEGFQTTCSFDYLTENVETKLFVLCIFIWAYVIPMFCICCCYFMLFVHVQNHERMLKEQARKMNIKSLVASNGNNNNDEKNVELRIAKAALTIFFLFCCSWTPYAIVTLIGAYGNKNLLTPSSTMIPAVFAKVVSCIDPWVYAISHPRYRLELEKRVKWLGIRETVNNNDNSNNNDNYTESRSVICNVDY